MIELAAAAVTVLTPYLVEAGHEAAKTVGKDASEAAGKLLGWLREKLTPRGKEALAELEHKPTAASNQDDVRVQLTKLLEQEPGLTGELRSLLEAAGKPAGGINVSVGAGAKSNVTVGRGNTSSIS